MLNLFGDDPKWCYYTRLKKKKEKTSLKSKFNLQILWEIMEFKLIPTSCWGK
jgi:hypothetical protein